MKLKKLIAGLSAAAVAASCMAISAFAEDVGYDVSYNEPYVTVAPEGTTKVDIVLSPIINTEDSAAAQWNDYCTLKIVVRDADGIIDYAAVIGSSVNWDTTVDDNGTPDDTEDDIGVTADESEIMWTDADTDVITLEAKPGATLTISALGWSDSEETAATPYFTVKSVAFDDGTAGTAPSEDAPAEDAPAEDTPAEDTPAEETPADDAAGTGLGAIALVGLALSGAAAVASKKRK